MRTISLTTDCKSRQQVSIGSFSQISWCRPSEPWWKYTRDTWDVGEKYEKLDVGSLTVAECNDAFTAGLDDDNWNTRSTWCFCKNIIWPFKDFLANIYLSMSKYIARLHNCQFEFTLVSFCFALSPCVHIMWRGKCWRDGMSMFALAEKKSYKAKQFFEVTFLLQNQTCIKLGRQTICWKSKYHHF